MMHPIFVSAIENKRSKIACLEEIALNNKWINKNEIKKSIIFYDVIIQNI